MKRFNLCAFIAAAIVALTSLAHAGDRDSITIATVENKWGSVFTTTNVAASGVLYAYKGGMYVVSPTGGTNNELLTVTLSNPETKGSEICIYIPAPQTNRLTIADSGNVLLASAWTGATNDCIRLVAVATNLWVETVRSDN